MADGNIAAMREALDDIIDKIDTWRSDGTIEHWQYSQLFDIADAALAAPVRNCDVGNQEEQIRRFDKECLEIRKRNTVEPCGTCLCALRGEGHEYCQLLWAQMPYKEGGAE